MISPFHFMDLTSILFVIFLTNLLITSNWLLKFYFKQRFKPLIFIILVVNLFSLTPFMLCLSCYIWNNFLLSLVLFFIIILGSLLLKLNKFLRHLLPSGRPLSLWDILYYLEFIRIIIRPLTLSLRLTCNLITGHVLITLISNLSALAVILSTFFYFFEASVRVIQRQVFTLLVKIYSKE
jgi:F0F1-type ATP synthase membrane subunit a